MGRKKSFTTNAFSTLTGESPARANKKIETVEKKVAEPVVQEEVKVAESKTEVSTPVPTKPKPTTRKAKKDKGLVNPNKRSVKKSHTPVTLYLNATNLDKLKAYAEDEEQKISWLIDEMIFEFLSDRLDG